MPLSPPVPHVLASAPCHCCLKLAIARGDHPCRLTVSCLVEGSIHRSPTCSEENTLQEHWQLKLDSVAANILSHQGRLTILSLLISKRVQASHLVALHDGATALTAFLKVCRTRCSATGPANNMLPCHIFTFPSSGHSLCMPACLRVQSASSLSRSDVNNIQSMVAAANHNLIRLPQGCTAHDGPLA